MANLMNKVAVVTGGSSGIGKAIAPGAIRTNIWNVPGLSPEEAKKHEDGIAATIPFGRFGEPEDIANMAAFLVSDEASYISGGIFAVDGAQGAL